MAASPASAVNEKHYHAALLLHLRDQLSRGDIAFRAQYKALTEAAVAALYQSYVYFVKEVSDSCKVSVPMSSALELADHLKQQGLSHAVVDTLLALASDASSWLSVLISLHSGDVNIALPRPSAFSQKHLISVSQADEPDVHHLLTECKQFVEAQRDYLQEW